MHDQLQLDLVGVSLEERVVHPLARDRDVQSAQPREHEVERALRAPHVADRGALRILRVI